MNQTEFIEFLKENIFNPIPGLRDIVFKGGENKQFGYEYHLTAGKRSGTEKVNVDLDILIGLDGNGIPFLTVNSNACLVQGKTLNMFNIFHDVQKNFDEKVKELP